MSAKRVLQVCLILVMVLVSLAATRDAQASSWCGSTYVVQRGDWLAKIARRCGVSLSQLYAANPWARYNSTIYPGQVIYLYSYSDGHDGGGVGCGPSWDTYGAYWVVCRGDTLGKIARYYGTTWTYLQWYNGIPNANRIYPGQIIRL